MLFEIDASRAKGSSASRVRRILGRAAEILAGLLLLLQLLSIFRGAQAADSFFSWSPHDQRVEFRIIATRRGIPVDPQAIQARYGLPEKGRNWHRYGDILRIVTVAESRLPEDQRWQVRVEYSVNLGEPRAWSVGEAFP